jgi:hypothetical protein
MAELELPQTDTPGRFQFNWAPEALFRPRQAFAKITAQHRGLWLTPLLILTVCSLLRVVAAGYVRQNFAAAGEIPLPDSFQYYTPEQQAQFMQAMQSTQGPVFVYVFPAISALLGIWLGWLMVGGLLHLVLTMLGGRGDTMGAMNLVAWAGLPFALRDLVRAAALLVSRQPISSPGLSGFAPLEATGFVAYLAAWLPMIDLYLIWHILLLVLGVRVASSLPLGKASGGAAFTVLLVLALQALVSYLASSLGALTVIRPFF